MTYIITEKRMYGPSVYRKKSYDSFQGHWTPYACKAQKWQTKAAAEKAAAKIIEFNQKCQIRSAGITVEEME